MNDGKITVIIVDDNLAAIQILAETLERNYGASTRVLATATNAHDAEALITDYHPDLLFLDVELPDISGLDYASELRRRMGQQMRIVIYTSYEKYLIGALRANAFDFLLKPLVENELATVMDRYVAARGADVSAMRPAVQGEADKRPLLVTTITNEKLVVRPDSVGMFRFLSDRKRWEVVLANGKRHLLFGQTTAEDILGYCGSYVRIHKAYIINIDYLATINDNTCVMLPPFDNADDLHVSKNYRKDLVARFYSL